MCTHIYICMCHQIGRIVTQQKAQHKLLYLVFSVQHTYLDTSTSKANYIFTFLGCWELCFVRKTSYTSCPSFSLVSKMSNQDDLDIINQAINQEILNLESKIADWQEAIEITLNNRQNNWSKAWKKAINCELQGLYSELKENQDLLYRLTH